MTLLCLQGGAEFGSRCQEMDRELLALAPAGPVVIAPLAAAPGADYEQAGANGERYYRGLRAAEPSGPDGAAGAAEPDGAAAPGLREIVVAPDARADRSGALGALRGAAVVVLPGGSPSRLRAALDGAVAEVLRERFEAGALLCGASAGAMLLCEWTRLPESGTLARGLGLLPAALVVPHWSGKPTDWDIPDHVRALGIPEQSGVLVSAGTLRSLGDRESAWLTPHSERIPR